MGSYSVLLSIYAGADPAHLRESVGSMMRQSVLPGDFVLVCDGPLTAALEACVAEFQAQWPGVMQVVRLPENVGIGAAANAGLPYCREEIIVKMDADDISLPDRCARQLACFAADPSLAIVGGDIEEFSEEDGRVLSVRSVPRTHEEILRFARRRAPFNNQTIAYKKQAALAAGGYADLRRCEDYEFTVRLLQNGARACNLPVVLVRYRLGQDHFRRRKSWENTKAFWQVHRRLYQTGFSGLWDYWIPCAAQLLLFLLPWPVTAWFYQRLLRK